MLNSLDALVVVNRLSEFGRFSYPVKLYEAMACQIPVIATRTPPAEWILGGREQSLAKPDDPADLVEKVKRALPLSRFHYGQQNTWEQSSRVFEEALGSAWKTASRR
jgi:glycosyltransferase involved in cell wall biosynthesis